MKANLLVILLILAFCLPGYAVKKKFTPEGVDDKKPTAEEAKAEEKKDEKADKDKKKAEPKKAAKKEEPKKEEPKKVEPAVKQEPVKQEPVKKEEPKKVEPVVKQEPVKQEPAKKEEPKKVEPVVKQEPVKQEPVKKEEPKKVEPVTKDTNEPAVFEGVAVDSETKKPLLGVKIKTNVFAYPALTMKDGLFKYPMKLKPGKYSLEIALTGYKDYKGDFEVPAATPRYTVKILMSPVKATTVSFVELPGKTVVAVEEKPAAVQEKTEPKPVVTVQTIEPENKKITVTGTLTDEDVGEPFVNEKIYVKGANISVSTDSQGKFTLLLEPGEYTLIIPVIGYVPLEEKIVVKEGLTLDYKLVSAETKKEPYDYKTDMAYQNLGFIPGVSITAPTLRYDSGLVIGGAPSYENGYYVNGHKLPYVQHLLSRDTVINPVFVESSTIKMAGFSSEYADASGGVIGLTLRDPRKDRIGGIADISLSSISILAEGPITEKDFFAASVRRGMSDIYALMFFNDKDSLIYPQYYDTTLMYLHEFSKNNKIKFTSIGSFDSTVFMSKNMPGDMPRTGKILSPDMQFVFNSLEWQYDTGAIKSKLYANYTNTMYGYSSWTGQDYNISANTIDIGEKFSFKFNDQHTLKTGVNISIGFYKPETDYMLLPLEGESSYTYTNYRLNEPVTKILFQPTIYVMDTMTYGDFIIEPGVVFTGDIRKKNSDAFLDPRVYAKYKINDDTSINISGGLYSQRAMFEMASEEWGSTDIQSEHSAHGAIGAEIGLMNKLSLVVDGFYKYYFNIWERDSSIPTGYTNMGLGYAGGGEVILKYGPTSSFSGWIGYAFTKNQRKDNLGTDYRDADSDIPHSIAAAATYKMGKNWAFGGKFSLTSGQPYTKLAGAELADNNSLVYNGSYYRPIYELDGNGRYVKNNGRYPLIHQLDIKAERFFYLSSMTIDVYAEIQGLTGFFDKNAVDSVYNADYSKSVNISTVPFIATLGFKGEF